MSQTLADRRADTMQADDTEFRGHVRLAGGRFFTGDA